MKTYSIQTKNGEMIAKKVRSALSFKDRLIGLMFSDNLGEWDGVLFPRSNSIHTMFMRYNLDLVFLGRNNKVVKIIRELKPWRMTRPYLTAHSVVELEGGSLGLDIKEGDFLEVLCIN